MKDGVEKTKPTVAELRLEAEQKATIIKMVLQSPNGKAMFEMLEFEFSDRSSFVPGQPDTTSYNEGQRSVILFMKDIIESDYEPKGDLDEIQQADL